MFFLQVLSYWAGNSTSWRSWSRAGQPVIILLQIKPIPSFFNPQHTNMQSLFIFKHTTVSRALPYEGRRGFNPEQHHPSLHNYTGTISHTQLLPCKSAQNTSMQRTHANACSPTTTTTTTIRAVKNTLNSVLGQQYRNIVRQQEERRTEREIHVQIGENGEGGWGKVWHCCGNHIPTVTMVTCCQWWTPRSNEHAGSQRDPSA